jgi:hypothetical protein
VGEKERCFLLFELLFFYILLLPPSPFSFANCGKCLLPLSFYHSRYLSLSFFTYCKKLAKKLTLDENSLNKTTLSKNIPRKRGKKNIKNRGKEKKKSLKNMSK